MKLTFRRGVLVRRQQRRRPSSSVNTFATSVNTLAWGHRITPISGLKPVSFVFANGSLRFFPLQIGNPKPSA
eukprot:scaffold14702_cov52-Phaeocystis_antarctica.AAC.1